jgi:hypothetical protein
MGHVVSQALEEPFSIPLCVSIGEEFDISTPERLYSLFECIKMGG